MYSDDSHACALLSPSLSPVHVPESRFVRSLATIPHIQHVHSLTLAPCIMLWIPLHSKSIVYIHALLPFALSKIHHEYIIIYPFVFSRPPMYRLSMSQHRSVITGPQMQLVHACASGDKAELLRLVSDGCDPVEIYNDYGQTLLHIASQHGQLDIVRLLVEAYGCNLQGTDKRGCKPLHVACLGGHMNTAVYLLKFCGRYTLRDSSGDTLLHKACRSGNLALTRFIVDLMLSAKVTYDKVNIYHDDVLHYHKCFDTHNPLIAAKQLKQKTRCLAILNSHGDTPLQTACRCGQLNIVKYFMDEILCVHGDTVALMQAACQSGQTEVLQYLLETKGAIPFACVADLTTSFINTNKKSDTKLSLGNSLMHTACLCGNITLVKTLLTQYNYIALEDKNGDTPLHCACISDNVSLVNLLVTCYECEYPNLKGNTPLHIACEWGSLRVATALINDFHCNPNICNEDGETPLHLTCKYGRVEICNLLFANDYNTCDVTVLSTTKETPLHMACCGTSPEIVKNLLRKCSFNQDIPDQYGDTPLFNACRCGEVGIVKLLTGKYCDPLYVNEQTKETPAHIACRMQRLDMLCILLIRIGRNLNQQNVFGETPLHIACKKDSIEIVNFLMQNNLTDPFIQDSSGATALHIACGRKQTEIARCLISSMSTCDQVDNSGNTPLTIACSRSALGIVKLLTTASLCNVNLQNKDGETALHIACSNRCTDIVELLAEIESCEFNLKNKYGNTPLHRACLESSLNDIVKLLTSCCDIYVQNNRGNTPIHIACQQNHCGINIVSCLLEGHVGKLDHFKNSNGFTPLHTACSNGALDIVQFLVQNQFCDLNETDQEGNTALHTACKAGNTEVAVYLISTECDLTKRNASGHLPLFYAVECKQIALVKHLVKEKYFDLADPDQTFHFASQQCYLPLLHFVYCCQMTDLVMFLIDGSYCDPNQQDSKGNTLLHTMAVRYSHRKDKGLLSYLLNREDCDLNCTNHKGATPLHVACKGNGYEDGSFVKTLLNTKRKMEVSPRDLDGKTPIQLAHNYEIIRLLIGHGANPQDVYVHYGRELERSKSIHPLDPFVKWFVLGNSEAGKSTLVESLKTETADPTSIVTVEGPTAGILQSEHESKEFGKVKIHDFAGHPEFHSSHSAFLENSLSPSTFSSPPIFLVVVNLNGRKQQIAKSVHYWIKYIENHCSSTCEVKPHAIIIGSHADLLSQTALPKSLPSLTTTLEIWNSSVLQYFGPHCLDCRKPGSEQLKSLRMLLRESCLSLRQHVELDCRCHVLFTCLHEHFKEVPAITVGELQGKIKQRHRLPLPYVVEELMKLLNALHDKGHLLVLMGTSEIKEHWVVLNQDYFLHLINGTIFAPQVEQHLTVETNTGVVPSSKLDNLFPELDPNMVKQFLVYSEFCQKIEDKETLKLIQGNEDSYEDGDHLSCTPMESENSCFFFPELINSERPAIVWNQQDSQDRSYSCGWCIQCKPQQFLTARFLQVLLLRLVFSYAAVVDEESDTVEAFGLKRRCDIWKNGTQWCSRCGVEVLVEVIEQNSVVLFLMQCLQGQELECVKLRSAIIGKILAAKEKFCPQVEVKEYFINSSDVACYPNLDITAAVKVEMREVAKTVCDAERSILYHRSKSVLLDRLLYFEPYSKLGKHLLTSVFDPKSSNNKVPSDILLEISSMNHHALRYFVCMLQVPNNEFSMRQEQWQHQPSIVLHHVFEYWQAKKIKEGTYQELREEFDKYSIFCGRNPLHVCTQTSMGAAKGISGVQ